MKRCLVLVLVAACSGGHSSPKDAAVDAKADAPPDSGMCPAARLFTGELVDWDSSEMAFCGVFGATYQVQGDPSRIDQTNPNGRFQICLASAAATRIDITPPTDASQCTVPMSTYSIPGLAVADPAVIATGKLISMRAWTDARAASLGFTPDAAKANVFVHVENTPQPVSISSTSDTPQYWNGTTWSTTGPTGIDVFFPNVDVGTGMTTVTMMGGAVGSGAVPVEAGKITYVTLVGN